GNVAMVVGDGLLAQHVLARLDRGTVDLEVVAVPGDHVDDVDVIAFQQVGVVTGGYVRAVSAGRGRGPFRVDVAHSADPAARIPGRAGRARPAGPAARPDHAYAESLACHSGDLSTSSWRRQRASRPCPPIATSSVSQDRHSSTASRHRGANRQPPGTSMRLGGDPEMLRNWPRCSPCGTASSRALV